MPPKYMTDHQIANYATMVGSEGIIRRSRIPKLHLAKTHGRHPSQHSNKWEKARNLPNAAFRNRFHIHMATERYQLEGFDIDGYAEVTPLYDSFETALEKFVRSNGLSVPEVEQKDAGPNLFKQGKE